MYGIYIFFAFMEDDTNNEETDAADWLHDGMYVICCLRDGRTDCAVHQGWQVTLVPTPGVKLVEGMTGYDETTGKWNIVIDSANTDWEKAVWNGLDSRGFNVLEFCYNTAPSGAEAVAPVGMFNNMPQDAYEFYQGNLHYLNTCMARQSLETARISLSSGYYNVDSGMFFPEECTDEMYSAFGFRWKLADGSYKAEHSLLTLTFEPKISSVSVRIHSLDSQRFVPDSRFNAETENGRVSYIDENQLAVPTELVTGIFAPAGTADAKVNGYGMNGRDRFLSDMDGGKTLILKNELPAGDVAREDFYVVTWLNASGKPITCERFSVKVSIGQPKPWPVYVKELKKYGENEATIKIGLWGKVKDKGIFHDQSRMETFGELRLSARVDELIEAAASGIDLTDGGTDFTINPPKKARYYRQFPAGSNNIYNMDIQRVCPLFNGDEEVVLPVEIEGNKVRMQYGYLGKREVPLADGGTMTYYFCNDLLGEYAGTVDMFFWYDEDMKRIGQNYLIHTHDDVPLISTVPLLTKEEDMAKWKGKPAAVFLGTPGKFNGVELLAERMPSSPNTHYYNLKLVAPDETTVDLKDEKVVLYLPYPEGKSQTSAAKLNITVGHYDDNHNLIASDVYSMERGNLQFTPYGLRLEVSSFSPYVVSWEEAAALPQTGDDFPMALLLGVMTLSLCVMLRKRAKA